MVFSLFEITSKNLYFSWQFFSMDDFPGNRHSETEKIQRFTKDANFIKMC